MSKGIIIAVPEKYEHICYKNLLNIRYQFKNDIPIEIWEIGKEISDKYRNKYSSLNNIIFKNVLDIDSINNWKGFQIKGFIIKNSSFDEFILCDADIVFYQNPILLFEDINYKETGTYFFRDLEKWKFTNLNNNNNNNKDKFTSLNFFLERKKFISNILPNKSNYFPNEWNYIYQENIPIYDVLEAYQESGCVYMNKNMHIDSINNIFLLNLDYNTTYKFIWGDKETFWLGCLISNKKFYMNKEKSYLDNNNKLCHNYNSKLFFVQKP